jgi:phosphoribosylpyrophosphate synthetase
MSCPISTVTRNLRGGLFPVAGGSRKEDHQATHEKGVQVSYSKMKYNTFTTEEILLDVPQSVRGKHVYFLHGLLAEDPNIALMRYLLSADALTQVGNKTRNGILGLDRQTECGSHRTLCVPKTLSELMT